MFSILPSLLILRNVFTLLRHVLLGLYSYDVLFTISRLPSPPFSTREHVATIYYDLLTASFFLPVVHLLLLSPSGISMRVVLNDVLIEHELERFRREHASAPILLRFNFKRWDSEKLNILKVRIAEKLGVSPEAIKLYERFLVVADFVFLCEDSACNKVKPRPLCTVDSFQLLKAFLEL